ncbi:hypothetical protein MUK42_35823 [Musa troglodytarum]|uniref:Uncharacterized protein n=1 Tax=Musa troglodytarum TaxID=320322 RepID=A0A9E7H5V6_9LILI|nr:hypothetical protein MUK42_35823 [Musa troglodytarum]
MILPKAALHPPPTVFPPIAVAALHRSHELRLQPDLTPGRTRNGRGLSEEDDSRNNEALEDKESGDSPLGQLLELSSAEYSKRRPDLEVEKFNYVVLKERLP